LIRIAVPFHLLLFCVSIDLHARDFFQEAKILSEQLQEKYFSGKEKKEIKLEKGTRQCFESFEVKEGEPNIMIFVSFSIPENIWLQLSEEAKSKDAVFVLKGLPNDSFSGLAKKVLTLKKKGFSSDIQIDPTKFDKHGIEKVPAFVVGGTKKIYGAVPLNYVLSRIQQEGNDA